MSCFVPFVAFIATLLDFPPSIVTKVLAACNPFGHKGFHRKKAKSNWMSSRTDDSNICNVDELESFERSKLTVEPSEVRKARMEDNVVVGGFTLFFEKVNNHMPTYEREPPITGTLGASGQNCPLTPME